MMQNHFAAFRKNGPSRVSDLITEMTVMCLTPHFAKRKMLARAVVTMSLRRQERDLEPTDVNGSSLRLARRRSQCAKFRRAGIEVTELGRTRTAKQNARMR